MGGVESIRGKYRRIRWAWLGLVIAVVLCAPNTYRAMIHDHASLLTLLCLKQPNLS